MTPTEFHRRQRSDVFARRNDEPAAAAANVDKKDLIIGGSIGLFMVICAITFMVQGYLRRCLKKRRQAKEVEGHSLELQKIRLNYRKPVERKLPNKSAIETRVQG